MELGKAELCHHTHQFIIMSFTGLKKCSINRLLQKMRNDDGTVDSDLKQRLIDTWASVSQKTSKELLINGEAVTCMREGERISL